MRPMSAEFASRPRTLIKRLLGALGFVAFGVFATLDTASALVSRVCGGLIVLSAGFFAWLDLREMVWPGTRLILDRQGLHLRRRPPETDFDGDWAAFYAVRVDRSFEPPRAVVTFVHGLPEGHDDWAGTTATELHLPEIIGHPPERIVAEIGRFHRAYLALRGAS